MKKAVAYLLPYIEAEKDRQAALLPHPQPLPGGEGSFAENHVLTITSEKYTRLKELARLHRKKATKAEDLLWQALRGKQLGGYKFRRQHAFEDYIVDFICLKQRIVIEVDGGYHEQQQEYDALRTEFLQSLGYRVLRFTNNEVVQNLEVVLQTIKQELLKELPKEPTAENSPLPRGGAGGGASRYAGKVLLATVKGDVHDIGKNIVGVVLACNNYEIVDLGVMVSCDKILQTAIDINADIIGLSGLITPSLDEMVFVAKEMERLNFKTPLIIGGATTSRAHTAVKIDQNYSGPVVHVLDASRTVPVVGNLLQPEQKETYAKTVKAEYEVLRDSYLNRKKDKQFITLPEARANKFPIEWRPEDVYTPKVLGTQVFTDYPLGEIVNYIDWTPFFQAWELHGKYPKILSDEVVGAEAVRVFEDAQVLLKKVVKEKLLQANAVVGIYPANTVNDDDIEVYTDESRQLSQVTFRTLRQQGKKGSGVANLALADFIAPKETGLNDYIGGFAVQVSIAEYFVFGFYRFGVGFLLLWLQ